MVVERFRYRAFGLEVESDLEIAHLQPCAAFSAGPGRRLTLRRGAVEPTPKPVTAPGSRRGFMRTLFRYEAVNGSDVTIDCLPSADRRNVADMIISRMMTIVMYQRGVLPLHASAVDLDGGIVALCGPSGSGKSTLALMLARRGHALVSDDMLPVRAPSGQSPRAFPGAQRLKIAPAVLAFLGCGDDKLPIANTEEDKVLTGLASLGPRDDSELWFDGLPLKAIIRIRRGPLAVKPLRPLNTVADWPSLVRSPDLMPVADPPEAIWQQWLNVATNVPAAELCWSGKLSELAQAAKLIEDHLVAA